MAEKDITTELSSAQRSEYADVVADAQIPLCFDYAAEGRKDLRVLSLFSGCGGMDLGFEGGFICHRKSVHPDKPWIFNTLNENWVCLRPTRFYSVFANDILPEAQKAWLHHMKRYGYEDSIFHNESIVDLVKMQQGGADIFPKDVDVVTGGFPCQDFSVSGKRQGFDSNKDHNGNFRLSDEPLLHN